ncbi:MAG: L-aspartate oxidase [Planctomycetota bacterium]|nr:L-aspartate oxidase [Planctomycetota bacterium]
MKEGLPFRRFVTSFHSLQLPHRFTDCLVIGSGAAGLQAALEATRSCRVTLLAKESLEKSNTALAQGGIAASLSSSDSPEKHLKDTLQAGAGLADEEVGRFIIEMGPGAIHDLEEMGANFDRHGEEIALTREGGHTEARVVHARGDSTGRELSSVLGRAVKRCDGIRILEETFVVDLIDSQGRCSGAIVLSGRTGQLEIIWSKVTVLATGGAGRIWRETTNPAVATGDGLAIAFRAGAVLRDLEFVQFHPTTLYLAGAARALISEAVRGEGAYLRDKSGDRFMTAVHPDAELAPRDVVSRTIVERMLDTGDTRVFLDLSHLDPDRVRRRFPGITAHLAAFDIDITSDPIPVRPSAHYMVGGVSVDLDGRTSVPGLFACGEVASTGFHGANRLGSNSLLEALVLGRRAGVAAALEAKGQADDFRVREIESKVENDREVSIDLEDVENSLRSLMWMSAGVRRDGEGLETARESLAMWAPYVLGSDLRSRRGFELQNRLTAALLITEMALRRDESRGVHYRTDCPARDDARWARHQQVHRTPDGAPSFA